MLNVFKNFSQFIKLTKFAKKTRAQILENKSVESIKNEKIIFCPFNSTILNLLRESIIAGACEKKGAQVSFFQFDLEGEAIDFLYNESSLKFKIYYKLGQYFYKKNKLKLHRLSECNPYQNKSEIKALINKTPTKELKSFVYKGIEIGRYAIASSIRHYMAPFPLWDNPEFEKWVRDFVFTGCLIADGFGNLLDQEKPDKIVTSHAIYISWGVLYDVARARGYNVDVYNGSYRKNTLRFYKNAPNAPFPIAEWPMFENTELNEKELQILDSYTASREDQKDDNISLFSGDSDYSIVDEFVQKAKTKGAKLTCLFTNSSWDAYAHANNCPFSSMEEWLLETIEHLRKQPNIFAIVKAHPAEVFHKVPDDFRVKTFVPKNLPENILFIDENANIKPFYLYNIIDFGIIHLSTVCIEMALKEIPVLTSGANSHYSNKGFTIDPISKEEYFSTLNALGEGYNTFKPNVKSAKNYMYYRFFREAIPFDVVEIQNGEYTLPKGYINNFKGINTIAEGIVNDKKFIFDWSE